MPSPVKFLWGRPPGLRRTSRSAQVHFDPTIPSRQPTIPSALSKVLPWLFASSLRLCVSAVSLFLLPSAAAPLPYFSVLSEDPGAWPAILSSIGLQRQPAAVSHVFVARTGAAASTEWNARVANGAILILEGESSLAAMFGFRRTADTVKITSLTDFHHASLPIVWEKGLELPVYDLPAGSQVFARDRWSKAPLMAGFRRGSGAVLWIAVPPGERGYERFPYLLNALCDLGLEPPFRSARLWAFFDSAYRSRVDLDYFAARWRASGIAALQVAAWHFYEPNQQSDAYLRNLIAACHRQGILVYAWLELPHVSEKFWADHPEWREKTAVLQDAQLDWRKLMNLANPDCFRAVSAGVKDLVARYDWDGVNLAELYFESLEGIGNPSRFTPMNADIRAEFQSLHGVDPLNLVGQALPPGNGAQRSAFLDYRTDLAHRLQLQWLGEIESLRRSKPDLDLVLTHVDDRFDTGMRDAIGADAARVLPLLDTHRFTFLIEDPATVWHLGAQRYQTIADRYRALTSHTDKLAVDLNIVERYQNVYPTKQQTGTELFELVHAAVANFPRVALYFENSLLPPDLALLPSAAAPVTRMEKVGPKTVLDASSAIGLPWKGPALVDGQPWPVLDAATVWLPVGPHSVEPGGPDAPVHVLRFNGDLRAARIVDVATIEFSYENQSRAIAILDRIPSTLQIDGTPSPTPAEPWLLLPRGQHVVTLTR
jgi:hypothetical protein